MEIDYDARRNLRAVSCRHFNGTINDKCEAGISYDEVSRVAEFGRTGRALRLPCHMPVLEGFECSGLVRETESDIAEREEQWKQAIINMRTARKAIVDKIGPYDGKSGCSGQIECPVCETGKVTFSRAGINGHIHARCSTKGCVCWME